MQHRPWRIRDVKIHKARSPINDSFGLGLYIGRKAKEYWFEGRSMIALEMY